MRSCAGPFDVASVSTTPPAMAFDERWSLAHTHDKRSGWLDGQADSRDMARPAAHCKMLPQSQSCPIQRHDTPSYAYRYFPDSLATTGYVAERSRLAGNACDADRLTLARRPASTICEISLKRLSSPAHAIMPRHGKLPISPIFTAADGLIISQQIEVGRKNTNL